MSDETILSSELWKLEMFFSGNGAGDPAWPGETEKLYDFAIGQLQDWFRIIPPIQSRLCGSLIPHLARFLLNCEQTETEFPIILDGKFLGDPRNSVALIAKLALYFDWASVMTAKLVTSPDQDIIEVGANIGTETIPFAALVPQGQVLAIEPEPQNAIWIEKNVQLNDLSNVTVLRRAASDSSKKLQTMGYQSFNTGLVYTVESQHSGENPMLLDDLLRMEDGVSNVSYLHIDVEGFETKVIRGADKLLDKFRPVMYVEAQRDWLQRAGTSIDELYQVIRDRQYELFRFIASDGVLIKLESSHLDRVKDENWLALPIGPGLWKQYEKIATSYHDFSRNSDRLYAYFAHDRSESTFPSVDLSNAPRDSIYKGN